MTWDKLVFVPNNPNSAMKLDVPFKSIKGYKNTKEGLNEPPWLNLTVLLFEQGRSYSFEFDSFSDRHVSGDVVDCQVIATLGKGILGADENIGTIGKHLSSINIEKIEASCQALRELLFTSPHASRYLAGVIPAKSSSFPSAPPMAMSTASCTMPIRSPSDPKSKYQQLLFYRQKLMPLSSQHKTPENKVQGRVSQVWVWACLDGEWNAVFEADSDSVLAKGLAALLVNGLSEILQK